MPVKRKDVLRLSYPENTDIGAYSKHLKRMLRIEKVRDLSVDPLTPWEFLKRPLTNRGRWLITAKDVERHCFRQFYLASSGEYHCTPDLKIGVFHNGKLIEVLEAFEPTRRERVMACKFVKLAMKKDLGDYSLGIFSDDLRLIG